MTLVVKPVDLVAERTTLLDVLQRNLKDLDHAARFEWLYLRNPAGRARSWFVYDSDHVVGMATVFPRFFRFGARVERAGQVGDFAVDTGYRSLGPALRLQRATLELVDQGVLSFCYDCPPHERGMATFRRLGLKPLCRMVRFIQILKADETMRRHLPFGRVVQEPATVLANVLLAGRRRTRPRPKGVELTELKGSFGEQFDALEERLRTNEQTVRARRAAEDLNWRYRADPIHEYSVVTASRRGELVGFSVLTESGPGIRIVELVALSDTVHYALLHGVREKALSRGDAFINMYLSDKAREPSVLKAGFVRREIGTYVVVYSSDQPMTSEGTRTNWEFSYSDTIA